MYREINAEEVKLHKAIGYMYFLDREHPFASGRANFVYYHRHVASISLGRWITSEEEVHHIDEDKQNNDPSNLEVLDSHTHRIRHGYLDNIDCFHCKQTFKPSGRTTLFCSLTCNTQNQVRNKGLTKEILEPLIWSLPYIKVANIFGYSDVGVKKRAKALGCILPPPYFFNKNLTEQQRVQMYLDASIVK